MSIYVGKDKVKIRFGNSNYYKINIQSSTPIYKENSLLSSDNLILKDSNGIYLTAKEVK